MNTAVGRLSIIAANIRSEPEARVAMAAQTLTEAILRLERLAHPQTLDQRTIAALDTLNAALPLLQR
jgi:hypothetical protein